MARPISLSNNTLYVGLNNHGLVDDMYYPYVGQENLKNARIIPHQVGVMVNGVFSWVGKGWDISMRLEDNAMISTTEFTNEKLGIKIISTDAVDSSQDAFMRQMKLVNIGNKNADVKLFLHQVFQLSRDSHADTAYYIPEDSYIFDYKGHTAIIAYSELDGQPFESFAVGNYAIEGKSGTYKDAEDGELSGNLVEHGGVDSVMGHSLHLVPLQEKTVNYWLAVGYDQRSAEKIHLNLRHAGLSAHLESTRKHWQKWLQNVDQAGLQGEVAVKVRNSLLTIKSHIDKNGAIIASCDSSLFNYGRDYYGYCWPRDGAYAIWPLIKLGYTKEPLNFFDFCMRIMKPEGYLQHKFQADGAYGSTWHPLMQDNHKELAIQEDETAIVLYMVAEYVEHNQDNQYYRDNYNAFIKPCLDFMANFIDQQTGLPHGSYDLWEQKFLTNTYTALLVSNCLRRHAKLASELIENSNNEVANWVAAAEQIDGNMNKLYDQDRQYFIKGFKLHPDGQIDYDNTLDVSSMYAGLMFGGQVRDSYALAQTVAAIESELIANTPNGGVPRFYDDNYLQTGGIGNPWFVCTFWLAQYYNYRQDFAKRDQLVSWAEERIHPSGMLSEQINPNNGDLVGVGPLVWSHAEYVNTLLDIHTNN